MSHRRRCHSVSDIAIAAPFAIAIAMAQACGGGTPAVPFEPFPSADGNYFMAMLTTDISAVLQYRQGIYSNRPLGNPDNVALWTPDKVALLYQAVVVARTAAYDVLALEDMAHLILAELAAESTGDYNVGIRGSPSGGWGLLQVTPDTVVVDYDNHGTALSDASGETLLQPGASHDLGNPATNTLLWAWYTKNAVAFGISADQAALGQRGNVVPDYGNALFAWLEGPGHDRHTEMDNADYIDYYQRNQDYFVQAGFGTAGDFNALMDTLVGNMPAAWKN